MYDTGYTVEDITPGEVEADIAEMAQHDVVLNNMADSLIILNNSIANMALTQNAIDIQKQAELEDVKLPVLATLESMVSIINSNLALVNCRGIKDYSFSAESYSENTCASILNYTSESLRERANEIMNNIQVFLIKLKDKFIEWVKSFFNSTKSLIAFAEKTKNLANARKDIDKDKYQDRKITLSSHEVKWLTYKTKDRVTDSDLIKGIKENNVAAMTVIKAIDRVNRALKNTAFTTKLTNDDGSTVELGNGRVRQIPADILLMFNIFDSIKRVAYPMGDSTLNIVANKAAMTVHSSLSPSPFKPKHFDAPIISPDEADKICELVIEKSKELEANTTVKDMEDNLDKFIKKLKETAKEYNTLSNMDIIIISQGFQNLCLTAINLFRTNKHFMLKSYKACIGYCHTSMITLKKEE